MSSASLITEITQPIAKGETAKWSYTSLIFSSFYAFPLVMGHAKYSSLQLLFAALIYLLFLALFFQVTKNLGKKVIAPITAIILLSTMGAGVYAGTNVLFGYAAYFSSYYFKSKQATLFLLFNLICQLIAAASFDLMSAYFLGPSIAIAVSLHVYGVFSRKDVINQLNRNQQNQQIEQLAAIAERERIARDMHDLLGHSLSSLALKSELAEKLIAKGQADKAAKEIEEVAALSRKTLSEVREAVTGLKKKSLKAGVADLIEQLEHLGFTTRYTLSLPKVNAKIESALLMLCKEWVTNILRHSSGNEVSLELAHSNGQVNLCITDNGRVTEIKEGNGISGMKSRVEELSGQLKINTGEGMKLVITLPISEEME